jgi:M6 family metalloprotease-like protein
VPVIVSGDEFYQDVETPDGYSLVRDPSTGWICFARPSSDGSQWISTGVIYHPKKNQSDQIALKSLPKHFRLNRSSILSQRKTKFFELNKISMEESQREFQGRIHSFSKEVAASGSAITPPIAKPDTVYGLTILIDFPDKQSAIPIDSIRNWLNNKGYAGYRNNGSIHDYFFDVSDGNMVYFNECTPFITAANPKSYYDAGTGYGGSTTLISEICSKLKTMNFNFSRLTVVNGFIRATNILYAGTADAGWANGLWPHSGTFRYTFVTGVQMSAHQLSNIGTSLSIGTFCHENGHMLCKWPDLYAYDDHDNGAGRYCIMSSGGGTNPQQPNPYFRALSKWITVINITNDGLGKLYSHTANGPSIYLWSGATNSTSAKEAYYIEARRKTGRSQGLPDEGLLIWHVDEAGKNTEPGIDLCVPEQADGLNQLENKVNSGADGDCFHAGYKTEFNDVTSPSAKWHNGANSDIQIANISAIGDTMTFSLGPNVRLLSGNDKISHALLHACAGSASNIRYTVPGQGIDLVNVKIDLYDLNGTLVKKLVNMQQSTGRSYSVAIYTDGSKVAAGTYLCAMNISGAYLSARVVVK